MGTDVRDQTTLGRPQNTHVGITYRRSAMDIEHGWTIFDFRFV